jgi:hypothetical protein
MQIIMAPAPKDVPGKEKIPTVYQPQGEQDAARRYFIKQ